MSRRQREKGMALLLVLGFVATFSVICAMMVTTVQKSRRFAKVVADRGNARYGAESAMIYAVWMTAADRRQYRNRRPGEIQLEREALGDEEVAWIADGATRYLTLSEFVGAEVKVMDANRGVDLSGGAPGRKNRALFSRQTPDDEPLSEEKEWLFDALDDYADSDDNRRLNGLERDDYEAAGWFDFPRNRPMQFREEAYWLDGIDQLVPNLEGSGAASVLPEDAIRIIPPPTARFSSSTKPSLFATSEATIRATTTLSEEAIAAVLRARRDWERDQIPIRESLGELYGEIAAQMETNESGVYTFEIRGGEPGGEITRKIVVTVDLRRGLRPRTRGAEVVPQFTWWQKVTY